MYYRKTGFFGLVLLLCLLAGLASSWAAEPQKVSGRILFMMTSHSEMFGTGKKTGVWLDAVATPYYMLKDAGYEVTLASVEGMQPPIDPRSEEEATPAAKRFLADKDAMQQFSETPALSEVRADGYAALYLPGGHGFMWDGADNAVLRLLVWNFANDRRIIAAVDHGPIALLGVAGPDHKLLVQGCKMAGFTKAEEVALKLDTVVPVYVDYSLERSGAVVMRGTPFRANAMQDGNVITGQNPASVEKVARLMLAALKKEK